jgi:hypothetical protein
MKTRLSLASLLVVALTVGIAAQSTPDLSGTWVPVSGATAAPPPPPPSPTPMPDGPPPPPPPPPRTLSMTISQTPTHVTIDRHMETNGEQTVSSDTYAFDGSETIRRMGVLVFRTKAAWSGGSLVLSSAVSAPGTAVGELTEIYRVVDGNLIVDSTRKSPAGTFSDRTVHARRP